MSQVDRLAHLKGLKHTASAENLYKILDEEISLTKVYNYFTSPKRIAEFNIILETFIGSIKRMVKPAKPKWLTVQETQERLLILWTYSEMYFEQKK